MDSPHRDVDAGQSRWGVVIVVVVVVVVVGNHILILLYVNANCHIVSHHVYINHS